MKGIWEYMGWSDIPELDSANTASDDNPFSGRKAVTPAKYPSRCRLKISFARR